MHQHGETGVASWKSAEKQHEIVKMKAGKGIKHGEAASMIWNGKGRQRNQKKERKWAAKRQAAAKKHLAYIW